MNFNSSTGDPAKGACSDISDHWLNPARFAVLLAALIIAFFPDLLLGGKSLVFRDYGIFTLPNAYFQRECFWHAELPLWNPLNNCGIPFLAQWNTAALYPLSLIYLVLPLVWGLDLLLLLHLFLAGFGMYLLASRWTHNRLAAAVAGIAFVFNGMTLNCMMQISNLGSLVWMPWVILLVEQAWLLGGRRIILAAGVGTLQMLAGAPELIAFTWLVLLALCTGKWIGDPRARGGIFARLTMIVMLISLLSAAQLLPFLDLLAHSERTSSFGTSTWTIPSWGWVNLFLPLFHCYKAPLGVYFQPGQDWTSSYYLGIGVLTLALLSLAVARTPRVWMLAAFAVFGFVAAVGDPAGLYPLLIKTFPVLGFMRYPIKFAFLPVFAIPLLAAYTIAWFRSSSSKSRGTAFYAPLGLMMVIVLAMVAVLWHARLHPFPYEQWPVLLHNGLTRIVFLVLIVGIVLIQGRIQKARLQLIVGCLLLAGIWLDAVTHAPTQNPAVDASVFAPGLLTQRLDPVPRLGEARAFMTQESHHLFYGSELTDLAKDYLGRRCALIGDCNILDGIPTPDGFYSLYVREQRTLFNQMFLSPATAFPAGLADFMGISYISDPEKVLAWEFRPTHLPCYSLGMSPVFAALSNTPALLLQTNFNPRQVVYLPLEAEGIFTATASGGGTVRALDFSNQQLDYETSAHGPTWLVLSQTYYHPWRAYVDGLPAPLLRANYAFQAVPVPAGSHRVKLRYEDRRFYLGTILSLTTLTGCLAFLWFWRRKLPGVGLTANPNV